MTSGRDEVKINISLCRVLRVLSRVPSLVVSKSCNVDRSTKTTIVIKRVSTTSTSARYREDNMNQGFLLPPCCSCHTWAAPQGTTAISSFDGRPDALKGIRIIEYVVNGSKTHRDRCKPSRGKAEDNSSWALELGSIVGRSSASFFQHRAQSQGHNEHDIRNRVPGRTAYHGTSCLAQI